jgi:putative membrane protein
MTATDATPTPPQLPAELAAELEGKPDVASSSTKLSIYRTRLAVYRTHVANLRSHLANERTHLAYLRTTVSLIGFGITLNRFSIFLIQQGQPETRVGLLRDTGNAGLGMVVLGLLLLAWSTYRYMRVGQDIERGEYVARQKGTLVASLGLLLLGGLTALWLFVL